MLPLKAVQWLTFYLVGVLETAENSIQTFHDIIRLRKEAEENILTTLGKKVPLALQLIQYLYTKPIADAPELAKVLNVNISTVHRLIQDFEKLSVLNEKTGYRRNRIFVFEVY